jgi:hypothetical protein
MSQPLIPLFACPSNRNGGCTRRRRFAHSGIHWSKGINIARRLFVNQNGVKTGNIVTPRLRRPRLPRAREGPRIGSDDGEDQRVGSRRRCRLPERRSGSSRAGRADRIQSGTARSSARAARSTGRSGRPRRSNHAHRGLDPAGPRARRALRRACAPSTGGHVRRVRTARRRQGGRTGRRILRRLPAGNAVAQGGAGGARNLDTPSANVGSSSWSCRETSTVSSTPCASTRGSRCRSSSASRDRRFR